MDQPIDSELRQRNGVYNSVELREGIKIIMLDIRYNREKSPGDILGEEQWTWFEKELQKQKEKLIILASSEPVLGIDKLFYDKIGWGQYPQSRHRLFELIAQSNQSVILISGDVHHAAFLKSSCSPASVQ